MKFYKNPLNYKSMNIHEVLTSNIVDLSSLKKFFSTDKDSLIKLIGIYISDTSPKIDSLEKNLTNINYNSLSNDCNYLKPSLGLMGIKCTNEITELEKQAQKSENEIVIKNKLNYVIPICRESIVEYKLILNKLETL